MIDMEKVVKGLKHCDFVDFPCYEVGCPYYQSNNCTDELKNDILALLKEQEKEIKSLRLLVEWAEECDFGFDQFPDEYERYKDEIKDMKYIDGMVHVAKRTLEDHRAFEEGR